MQSEYTEEFYHALRERTRRSARVVVPLILELVEPRSVVDVGCGIGIWLSVFKEHGVTDVLGIDGNHISRDISEIEAEQFLACDLTERLEINRQFDLVVSLEVAEHLPSESAELFVDSLTRLGPVILFSAAVPFQGGTHHVNEQWPDYWVRLFGARGYLVIDPIRRRIWRNTDVDFWYCQNSLIFVRQNDLDHYPLLRDEVEYTRAAQLSIVHPKLLSQLATAWAAGQSEIEALRIDKARFKGEAEKFKAKADPRNMSLRGVVNAFPTILDSAIKKRMSRLFSGR